MTKNEKLRRRLQREMPPERWYQNFELIKGSGIQTKPGQPLSYGQDKAFERLGITSGFWRGKRVLDIGAFDGALSFLLEDLGADVTALDIIPPKYSGFGWAHRVRKSAVIHHCASVYDLDPRVHGRFDCVLFFGVFYHLKHPLLALERINAVCHENGLLLGGGTTCTRWCHMPGNVRKGADFELFTDDAIGDAETMTVTSLNDLPICGFGPYLRDETNWFIPNDACLRLWIGYSGFRLHKLVSSSRPAEKRFGRVPFKRSAVLFRATRIGAPQPEYEPRNPQSPYTLRSGRPEAHTQSYSIPRAAELQRLQVENRRLKKQIRELKKCAARTGSVPKR